MLEITSIWRFPGVIGRSWTCLLTATLKFSIICSITIIVFHYNYHIPSAFELWWYNDSNFFVSHPPLFYGVQTPGDRLTAQENEKRAVSSVTFKEPFFPWASDHPLSKHPTVGLAWIFQPAPSCCWREAERSQMSLQPWPFLQLWPAKLMKASIWACGCKCQTCKWNGLSGSWSYSTCSKGRRWFLWDCEHWLAGSWSCKIGFGLYPHSKKGLDTFVALSVFPCLSGVTGT